jgi:hypothetical protein
MGVFAEETNTRSIMGNDSRMKFFSAARYFFRGESRTPKGWIYSEYPTNYDAPACGRCGFPGILEATSANRAMMKVKNSTAQKN